MNLPIPVFSSLLLLSTFAAGCLTHAQHEDEPEYTPIPTPTHYDLPEVDGTGVRDGAGVWFHEGDLASWAFFVQEIRPLAREAKVQFYSKFVPGRTPGTTDAAYVGNVEIGIVRAGQLDAGLTWGQPAMGPFSKIENFGPVIHEGTEGRLFLVSYAMSTVPGRLTLSVDFGGGGAASWNPSAHGADLVGKEVRTLESGRQVELSKPISPNSAALAIVGNDEWRLPAWRNLSIGSPPNDSIDLQGTRTDRESRNMVSAAGYLSFPERTVTLAADYRGSAPPHPIMLLTVPTDLAGWLQATHGLELYSHIFGKDYDAPSDAPSRRPD